MKEASERLKRLLIESQTFYIADLYRITLTDGSVLRYTATDISLTVGDERYTPLAIERDGTTQTNDMSVDEMHLTITVDPSERLDGETTIMQAVAWQTRRWSFIGSFRRSLLPYPRDALDPTMCCSGGLVGSTSSVRAASRLRRRSHP